MDLGALEELPLTYSEVGATASGQLPAGYDHLHLERQIGSGRPALLYHLAGRENDDTSATTAEVPGS